MFSKENCDGHGFDGIVLTPFDNSQTRIDCLRQGCFVSSAMGVSFESMGSNMAAAFV